MLKTPPPAERATYAMLSFPRTQMLVDKLQTDTKVRSVLPSPLKSPVMGLKLRQVSPPNVWAEPRLKLPSPLEMAVVIVRVVPEVLNRARSVFPSPLKSPARIVEPEKSGEATVGSG